MSDLFGRFVVVRLARAGDAVLFAARAVREAFRPPFELRETARQLYEIGWLSVPLIAAAGFAVGIVLSMHTRASLQRFGAEALIPAALTLALVRETGPLVVGLLVSGRVGAGVGAELGAMKVTEQVDALEASAVDSFKFLVVTRMVACVVAMPILTTVMNFTGIVGGWVAETAIRPEGRHLPRPHSGAQASPSRLPPARSPCRRPSTDRRAKPAASRAASATSMQSWSCQRRLLEPIGRQPSVKMAIFRELRLPPRPRRRRLKSAVVHHHRTAQDQIQHVVDPADVVHRDAAADIARNILFEVLLVELWQDHVRQPAPHRALHLLVDGGDRENMPRQRDLAGHRQIATYGSARQARHERRHQRHPGRGPVLHGDGRLRAHASSPQGSTW